MSLSQFSGTGKESLEIEKEEARHNIELWIKVAEEKADELWNKDQEQVRLFFKDNDERKTIQKSCNIRRS